MPVFVVNIMPNALSGETFQDSEPNLAVNPSNPLQIAASAFTRDPMGGANAPIYVSTDGGISWALNSIVPSQPSQSWQPGTGDITVRFGTVTSILYAGILRLPDSLRMNILRATSFTAATPMTVLVDRQGAGVDQPYIQAVTRLGGGGAGLDIVYVGNNDFNAAASRTATVDLSLDGAGATPPPPSGFTTARIETRATGTAGQDGPPIRPAVHHDGTVYAVFYGWRASAGGGNFTSDLVVVRDDNWGSGASPFTALSDPPAPAGDGAVGQRVVTGITVPFNGGQALGQERWVASNISIAVDPRNSSSLYVAWADLVGTTYTLHVRRSQDRGATWSVADLRQIGGATNPALAINSRGTVGFLYQQLTGTGAAQRWVTHLETTTNDWGSFSDLVLATVPATTPVRTFGPYLGDYVHLMAVGKDFYGIFSANNTPDNANFPNGVTFLRNANFMNQTLLANDGVTPVAVSIDPFFVKLTELAPDADFYVRDWTDSMAGGDTGLEPSTHPQFYLTSDVWTRRTNAPGGFNANDQPINEPPPTRHGRGRGQLRVHAGPAQRLGHSRHRDRSLPRLPARHWEQLPGRRGDPRSVDLVRRRGPGPDHGRWLPLAPRPHVDHPPLPGGGDLDAGRPLRVPQPGGARPRVADHRPGGAERQQQGSAQHGARAGRRVRLDLLLRARPQRGDLPPGSRAPLPGARRGAGEAEGAEGRDGGGAGLVETRRHAAAQGDGARREPLGQPDRGGGERQGTSAAGRLRGGSGRGGRERVRHRSAADAAGGDDPPEPRVPCLLVRPDGRGLRHRGGGRVRRGGPQARRRQAAARGALPGLPQRAGRLDVRLLPAARRHVREEGPLHPPPDARFPGARGAGGRRRARRAAPRHAGAQAGRLPDDAAEGRRRPGRHPSDGRVAAAAVWGAPGAPPPRGFGGVSGAVAGVRSELREPQGRQRRLPEPDPVRVRGARGGRRGAPPPGAPRAPGASPRGAGLPGPAAEGAPGRPAGAGLAGALRAAASRRRGSLRRAAGARRRPRLRCAAPRRPLRRPGADSAPPVRRAAPHAWPARFGSEARSLRSRAPSRLPARAAGRSPRPPPAGWLARRHLKRLLDLGVWTHGGNANRDDLEAHPGGAAVGGEALCDPPPNLRHARGEKVAQRRVGQVLPRGLLGELGEQAGNLLEGLAGPTPGCRTDREVDPRGEGLGIDDAVGDHALGDDVLEVRGPTVEQERQFAVVERDLRQACRERAEPEGEPAPGVHQPALPIVQGVECWLPAQAHDGESRDLGHGGPLLRIQRYWSKRL